MKTIAIVANRKDYAEYIKTEMEAYFKEYAVFHVYTTEMAMKLEWFEEDAVALSSWLIFNQIREKIKPAGILEVLSFTLSRENLQKLEKVPPVKKALLVNIDYRICMQVITQLYEAGYSDMEFIPYYGDGMEYDSDILVAVTPNEGRLVPPGLQMYDIGERTVDPNSVLRLANKLGIKDIFDSPAAQDAKKKTVLPQWGLDSLLRESANARNHIRAVIEHIEDGVLLCNNEGICYIGNEKSKEVLKVDAVDGLQIHDYISSIPQNDDTVDKKNYVATVDGKKLIFTVSPVLSKSGRDGSLILLKNFDESEERQHRLRNKVAGEVHEARYTFDDMKGNSQAIRDVITLARRIAKSASSVMILGESGTGKEVLAQSIHNESPRKKFNFVALNCAAIPENLLESELFGYEEGAFTGARKGGKIGYFELAHRGTIFLDEIGEMPLALQGKLLRVIEERKVARIGSSKLIDIDVRIIAATNRDVKQLVEEGKFREDLYYRLNVLPIKLPNLNEREEDILILFDNFRIGMGGTWTCDEAVRRRLLEYKWQGNIREVRNAVEYLDNLGLEHITLDDLPEYLKAAACTPVPKRVEEKEQDLLHTRDEFLQFVLREGHSLKLHQAVLEALSACRVHGKKAGRNQVKTWMDDVGYTFTETEIRTSMHKLAGYGCLRVMKGRGGSEILPEGETLLKRIKGLLGE